MISTWCLPFSGQFFPAYQVNTPIVRWKLAKPLLKSTSTWGCALGGARAWILPVCWTNSVWLIVWLICWPSCELRCFCGFPLFWQAWLLSLEAELLGSCGISSILHHMYSDSVGLLWRTFVRLNDQMKFKIFSVSHPQHPQQAPILFLDMCSAHLDSIDNGDMEGLPHSGNMTLKSNRHLKKLGSC